MSATDLAEALRELASPWLDADGAAAYLRCGSVRQFREHVAVQPGFPAPSKRKGLKLLWHRAELDKWLSE